jgi:hypothetical protein
MQPKQFRILALLGVASASSDQTFLAGAPQAQDQVQQETNQEDLDRLPAELI